MASNPPYFDTTNDEAWANLLCSTKCMRLADLLIDGDPYCFECAEEQTDYWIAISVNRKIQSALPPPAFRSRAGY